MQKKIIALALAAISGLAAGSAFAADGATLYGTLDYGFSSRGGNSGNVLKATPNQNNFDSGISQQSVIGLKGGEDLANGTKLIYKLEYGITIDNNGAAGNSTTPNGNNASPLFSREALVGLTGNWGTAVGGRLPGDRAGISIKFDPFAGGTVGNFGSLIGNQSYADNAVAYISPTFEGLNLLVAYSNNLTGDETIANTALPTAANGQGVGNGNAGNARLYAIRPEYNNGPIDVLFNFEDATVHGVPAIEGDIRIFNVAGSYDFGVVKVMGMYDGVKSSGLLDNAIHLDQKSYLIGAVAPVGGFNLKFSYADVKNDDAGVTAGDCKKTSVGGDYSLSKRTSFYADFAAISNDTNAACTIAYNSTQYSGSNAGIVGAGVDSTRLGNQTGVGTHGFDIGLVHHF
jgi:predicted porin